MTDRLQMWLVDEADFPAGGSEADLLRFVLRYAVLAPSSHNSQPWLFYVEGNAVEIYADRARRLPVVDPDDRELVMSWCAACTTYGSRSGISERDARLRCRWAWTAVCSPESSLTSADATSDPQLEEQFAAIRNRHTCRQAFDDAPIEAAVTQKLHQAALAEGARLVDVPDRKRGSLTSLVTEADFVQMSHLPSAGSLPG